MSGGQLSFVVVGGAGFLGRALVSHLANAGHLAHVIDLPQTLGVHSPDAAASCHGVSTEDATPLATTVRACRPDIVIDLAYLVGPPAEKDISRATRINLTGPLNTMQAALQAEARRYVSASSIAVYGPSTETWGRAVTEEDMLPLNQHRTAYGAFKCVNEFQLGQFAAQTKLSASSVRLSVVLGASRTRGLATWPGRFLKDVGAGKRQHQIPVPSTARTSLISATDAVRLLHLVAVHPQPLAVYNSGGHDLSARELSDLARGSHPQISVEFDEHAANIPFVHAVDNSRAHQTLGFALQSAADMVQEAIVDGASG